MNSRLVAFALALPIIGWGTSLAPYATVGSDLRRERIAVCLPASRATYNATECLRVEAAVATLWGVVYVLNLVAAYGAIVLLLGFAIPDRGAFSRRLPWRSKAGPGSADRAAMSGSVPWWGVLLELIALTFLIAPFWDW